MDCNALGHVPPKQADLDLKCPREKMLDLKIARLKETDVALDSPGLSSSIRTDSFSNPLPPYDRDLASRNICIAGLVLSYILAVICYSYGGYLYAKNDLNESDTPYQPVHIQSNSPAHILLNLALSIVISFCTDNLGYLHSVSLRWALWREGRLEFNSNIRLLTSARKSFLNSRFLNLLIALNLTLCYAASSQLLVGYQLDDPYLYVNRYAVMFLGSVMLMSSAVSHACLYKQSTRILSWSSNPLNTALVCLHHGLQRQGGRCLLAPDKKGAELDNGVQPTNKQPSMRTMDPGVRHIARFIWTLVPVVFIWGILVLCLSFGIFPSKAGPTLFQSNVHVRLGNELEQTTSVDLMFVAVFQGLATLGIHSVEVIVNRSRDEEQWRRATRATSGVEVRWNSVKSAWTSWQSIMLFLFKPFTHWFFGLSIFVDSRYICMSYLPIFIMGICLALLAAMATILMRQRPRGPLPSTFGHIQTLADLVDDWGSVRDGSTMPTLYWGDKGRHEDGVRHAGTSSQRNSVNSIIFDTLYR